MTDKVQKIREEVERLKSLIGNNSFLSDYEKGCNDGREDMCDEIISIIDSLQEELANESVDFEQELYKAFGQVKDFTLGMRIAKWFYDMGKKSREPVNKQNLSNVERTVKDWKEEPVSEDLKEASRNYADNEEYGDDVYFAIKAAFEAGAKWQKTKDESTTEDLGEYINELSKQFPEVSFAKLSRIGVRVAKWQRKEIYEWIRTHKDEYVYNSPYDSFDIEQCIIDLKQAMKDE